MDKNFKFSDVNRIYFSVDWGEGHEEFKTWDDSVTFAYCF